MAQRITQFSSPVITLGPQDSICEAVLLMQNKRIKRIVIARKTHPMGIVTERDIGKFLENDKTSRPLNKIPLYEIMSTNLVTIVADQRDHLYQCATRMGLFDISSVLVVDEDYQLVGITTKFDLVKNFAIIYEGMCHVKDYMTRRVITCRRDDSILFALSMLNCHKIARLIVTDHSGKPAGIITYNDFLSHNEVLRSCEKLERTNYIPLSTREDLRVLDLMEESLLAVEADDDLAKATKLMHEYNISGVPVVNKQGILEGVVSSTDIALIYSEEVPAGVITKQETGKK